MAMSRITSRSSSGDRTGGVTSAIITSVIASSSSLFQCVLEIKSYCLKSVKLKAPCVI
ncbi:hypothetical protein Hanom_Chr08g00752521 [Helianthus anomalus]